MNQSLPTLHTLASQFDVRPVLERELIIRAWSTPDGVRIVNVIDPMAYSARFDHESETESKELLGIGLGYSFEVALLRALVSHKHGLSHDELYGRKGNNKWAKEQSRHKHTAFKVRSKADHWLINQKGEISLSSEQRGSITCSLNMTDTISGRNISRSARGRDLREAIQKAMAADMLEFAEVVEPAEPVISVAIDQKVAVSVASPSIQIRTDRVSKNQPAQPSFHTSVDRL